MTYAEADLAIITIQQHRNEIQQKIIALCQGQPGVHEAELKFKKNNENFDKKVRKNLYAKCFCCCMSVNWRISQDAYHELDQHITMGKSVYQQCTGRKFPKNSMIEGSKIQDEQQLTV